MTGLWRTLTRSLLLAGPLGAAGLLYAAMTLPVGPDAPFPQAAAPRPPASVVEAPPPTPFRLAAVSSFSDMVERPLFSPARRPFVPDPPAAAAPPVTAPPPLELQASVKAIVLAREGRMTLVGRAGQKGVQMLTEGDELDGWRVHAITQEAVLFRQGARERRLFAAPPLDGVVVWGPPNESPEAQ